MRRLDRCDTGGENLDFVFGAVAPPRACLSMTRYSYPVHIQEVPAHARRWGRNNGKKALPRCPAPGFLFFVGARRTMMSPIRCHPTTSGTLNRSVRFIGDSPSDIGSGDLG